MNDISRHILILLGISLAMSSCADFSMQDGKAELYPPVFKVDTQVEEITQTKGDPGVPELTVPATQDIHFTVKDKDGKTVYDNQGVWSEALKMPVGSYSVEASYGSNTFGAPYYKGSCSGTIATGKEETPSITMSLCNALLATTLSDNLAVHFKADEVNPVRISTSSSSLDAGLGTYIFAPAGESLTVAISGQSSAGVAKTITHSLAARTAATATYVTCSLTTTDEDAPKITMGEIPAADAWGNTAYVPLATTKNISDLNVAQMQYFASANNWTDSVEGDVDVDGGTVKFTGLEPGATYKVRAQLGALKSNEVSMTMSTSALSIKTAAAHTYTNNELDGTDFTASFSVLDKFGVSAASLSLCKTDGTPLRTVALKGTSADWASDGSALTGLNDWPFLPVGSYIIKGTATQNGSSVTLAKCQLTVQHPDFKVSVSGKTTYDYSKTDINKANSSVAETIYEVGYSVSGISAALLKNSHYGLSCQYAININGNSKNVTPTDGTITGCAWGENYLTAIVTFADTQKTSSALQCHITGLPYKNDLKTDISGWKGKANLSIDGGLKISSNAKYAISPEFHIPSDIPIAFSYDVYNNGALSSTRKFCRGTVLNQSSSVNENDSSTPAAAQWTSQSTSSYSFNVSNYHCIFFYAPNQSSYSVYIRNLVIQYR